MNIRLRSSLTFLACALAVSCSSGGGGGGDGGGTPRSLSGSVTYDFVPATYDPVSETGTLSFGLASQKPVRGATVQVMKGSTVLATTSTDAAGHYALTFTESGAGPLIVVALAVTSAPVIQVQDNTDGGAVWGIGAALDATTTTKDLRATHGWTGSAFDPATRTAAPFAILDSMYTAARAFIAARPAAAFPALAVNWSPDNVPQAGNKAIGQIGTSHFSPAENQIYILGKDGVDTDEFDSHVIVHEWGHYFESNLSRSDSPGGPHSAGQVLDPRLSFGEGYGNALAAMLLPETMYVDTSWPGGVLSAFGFDAETEPTPSDDPNPGVFSETSVMRLLYDLFDSGAGEAFDGVAVGLGPVYDVLTGAQKTTPALTTIGSFVAGLKARPGVSAAAVNTLLAAYGIGPISDEWGTGDVPLSDMFVDVAGLASCGLYCTGTSILLGGGFDYNKWEQNQYYVFAGSGTTWTITATSAEDVALVVYRVGQQVAGADANLSGTETVSLPTTNGSIYVVNLIGFGATPGNYQVDLQFTGP